MPSKALFGTGSTQYFSDTLVRRYINLFAVAIGTTVSRMGYLRAARSLSRNILQLLWGGWLIATVNASSSPWEGS